MDLDCREKGSSNLENQERTGIKEAEIPAFSVYNLRFELNLPVRTSSLIFNLPECNSTCPKKYHNEWFYHLEEYSSKISPGPSGQVSQKSTCPKPKSTRRGRADEC